MFGDFFLRRRMRCQSGGNGEKIAAAANDPHVFVPWSAADWRKALSRLKTFGQHADQVFSSDDSENHTEREQ